MEENIIYSSQNINILELLYSIILKYDPEKENIISFSFDEDDLNYCSQYYLDGNNELTKYHIEPEPPYYFEGYEKEINKDFNLDEYIKTKFNSLVNILKNFDINFGELKIKIKEGEYIEDNEGNEIIIKKYEEIYFSIITVNKEDLKIKLTEYIISEIEKREFYYSIKKIEESILKEFEDKGKDNIKISKKNLGDIIGYDNKKYFKIGNEDGITIVYYKDVLELFLMNLYLEGKIKEYENISDNLYSLSKVKGKIIKIINTTDNEIKLLDGMIIYDKDKYLFYNSEKTKEYNIKNHGNYDIMMDILIYNIGEYVPYTGFDKLDIYSKKDTRPINKKITDTKDNLQKNVCKNLLLDYEFNKFIEVDKGLKLLI